MTSRSDRPDRLEICRSCGSLIRYQQVRPGAWAPIDLRGDHANKWHSCVRHIEDDRARTSPADAT